MNALKQERRNPIGLRLLLLVAEAGLAQPCLLDVNKGIRELKQA